MDIQSRTAKELANITIDNYNPKDFTFLDQIKLSFLNEDFTFLADHLGIKAYLRDLIERLPICDTLRTNEGELMQVRHSQWLSNLGLPNSPFFITIATGQVTEKTIEGSILNDK